MSQRRVHLWIRGHVQGVNYRSSTRPQGNLVGLTGWVRNMPDGRVEVVAEGSEESLQQLIIWCRRGPEWAEVEEVEVRWENQTGEFSRFGIAW
jgi:acylphosphatase